MHSSHVLVRCSLYFVNITIEKKKKENQQQQLKVPVASARAFESSKFRSIIQNIQREINEHKLSK